MAASNSARALLDSVQVGDSLKSSNLFTVSGQVAIVTGGGTGLGLVAANTLALNGCRVYITGRRAEPLNAAARPPAARDYDASKAQSFSGEIIPLVGDASTKEGILAIRAEIEARETYINILINNHGVSLGCADINTCEQTAEGLSKQMFDNEDFDTWSSTYRINTASYHFTTFGFLPLLAAAKTVGGFANPGCIINLSSISGMCTTSQRGQFNYNASKAATLALSKMQATEFARRDLGIRVNCICPGYFPSGMTVINAAENTGSDAHFKEFRNQWGIPFGRPGSAVDYAQVIMLASCNQYMTGAELLIDGGWMLEQAF